MLPGLLHCSQLKGEQKSEGDPIWSKKETLTTQKGTQYSYSSELFAKGAFNIKRRPKEHPNLQKGPLGEGPGFSEGDPLGNSGLKGALCLKGSLL